MVKVTFDIEIDRSLPWCVGKGDNADDRSFLDPGRMDGGQGWDKSSDIKGVNNGYWGWVRGVGGGSTAQFWRREPRGRKCREKGFRQKLKRISLHLEIKFCPQFSTKGKVNLIIKHLKLNKRKKNGFVWNFGPLNLQSMWKRFTQSFNKIFIEQTRNDVENDVVGIDIFFYKILLQLKVTSLSLTNCVVISQSLTIELITLLLWYIQIVACIIRISKRSNSFGF